MSRSSPAAVALICRDEGDPEHPYRPDDLTSGVSIGYGYDLGEHTATELERDWGGDLPASTIAALAPACGVRGQGAQLYLSEHNLAALEIPRDAALAEFSQDSLPQYEQELIECMPGSDQLPADVFGALTDLVYNRGPKMADDQNDPDHERRFEMRQIRSCVANFAATSLNGVRAGALRAIVNQLHAMADRLWPVPSTNRWNTILHQRRLDEAAMIEALAVTLDPTSP